MNTPQHRAQGHRIRPQRRLEPHRAPPDAQTESAQRPPVAVLKCGKLAADALAGDRAEALRDLEDEAAAGPGEERPPGEEQRRQPLLDVLGQPEG